MLSQPFLIAFYDVGQIDGREYIVMEQIDGITLKQYMRKRGGKLDWREALHFITLILQGLRHAHSRGIIHRDIKPQNVMVLRDGSVKVTDFGIARSATSQATMTQEAIGSVHYISPEQARGSHIDARSDLYSAGVVLYELLTGRLPYEGDNPVSVAIQHINSIPVSPRELNPEVPIGLEQITLHAMAARTDQRYANASEMLLDLDSFRKNPAIQFHYYIPGLADIDPEEPTVVKRGATGFATADNEGVIDGRRSRARFVHEDTHLQTESDQNNENDDEQEDEDNKKFIIMISAIGAALLILLIVLLFMLFGGKNKKTVSYTVPSLLGYTINEAKEYIAQDADIAEHFTVSISDYAFSDTYEAGQIMEQSPISGKTMSEETTEITVVISSGASDDESDNMFLDDYAGQDYRLVKNTLDKLGFSTSLVAEYSDDVEDGIVIHTDPEAGSAVQTGDSVSIYYSIGPEYAIHEMPLLLGQSEDYANSIAAAYGLVITIEYEYNDDYAAGNVCYQSIASGEQVQEGSALLITVSLGAEPVEVPDMLGMTEKEAIAVCEAVGLSVSVSGSEYSSSYAEGLVCSQSVSAGTSVQMSESISITLSLGEEKFSMPNLLGMTQTAASSVLSSYGVTIVVSGSEYSSSYAEGQICTQSISAGSDIQSGDTVTVTLSLGAEPTTKIIVVYLPSDRDSDCVVEITVNGSILYRGTVSSNVTEVTKEYEGDILSSSVTVDGDTYTDYDIL